jgi:hypothetical protein
MKLQTSYCLAREASFPEALLNGLIAGVTLIFGLNVFWYEYDLVYTVLFVV